MRSGSCARRKVLVTAEPGARIAALYFNEQDIVTHGRVLAKMDDVELVTQRRQLEAALNLAKTNLTEAEATLERTRSLCEKGYIARQEVDASQLQVDLYRTQVVDKQAAIQLLKAKIDQTLIRAPVSGAITRKLVEVGGVEHTQDNIVTFHVNLTIARRDSVVDRREVLA